MPPVFSVSPSGSGLAFLLRRDPVVITGLGAVSAAGDGGEALWEAVKARKSGAQWCQLSKPGGGSAGYAGFPAPALDWGGHPWAGMVRRLDPGGKMALWAAFSAARQAGILENQGNPPDRRRLGIICGSSRGPMRKWEEAHELLRTGRRMKATLAATTTLASASGALAQVLEARGPSWAVSAACASGAFAMAAAAEQIALGNADVMLAGGADQGLNAVVCGGLTAAGVMARGRENAAELCRPFRFDRTGLVPGDGAGMVVLESLSSARRRGVLPLAVLSGWGLGMDPEGLAGMNAGGAGLQRTMSGALALAGLQPDDIGYLNAHGTGTVTNDAAEAAAIAAVFGPGMPPCSSSKSITGHCLGATPALEAILCIEALRRHALPPAFPAEAETEANPEHDGTGVGVRGRESGDPARRIRLSRGGPCGGLRHTLSNSAGFWGFQASLILSRWDGDEEQETADRG
ncbi:MAG: beta-ketoacyl synthase N-terminal-like domain-containing protein [Verrucomicrobiota bacterium]